MAKFLTLSHLKIFFKSLKEKLSPVAFSGNYEDIIDTPELADVATSGDYNDLKNKPKSGMTKTEVENLMQDDLATVAFSGSYNDLINQPTIPEAGDYVTKGKRSGTTVATYATAEGYNTIASGSIAHAEGKATSATGNCAHAEGEWSVAIGTHSHAEGYGSSITGATVVNVLNDHEIQVNAGGVSGVGNYNYTIYQNKIYTVANTYNFGSVVRFNEQIPNIPANTTLSFYRGNIAYGKAAHAEGNSCKAIGINSHAEGEGSAAMGNYSHAENHSSAMGNYSHAEGNVSIAAGAQTHAEGNGTVAAGTSSHAEGDGTGGTYTFTGIYVSQGSWSVSNVSSGATLKAFDIFYITKDNIVRYGRIGSVDTINNTIVVYFVDNLSFNAEESFTFNARPYGAFGNYSHAEGYQTNAVNTACHAEGNNTIAAGLHSHAEGHEAKTTGNVAHAEGYQTYVRGNYAHAEGYKTTAYENRSHAEGSETQAIGEASHAEGKNTLAIGEASHAEGKNGSSFEVTLQYSAADNAFSIVEIPSGKELYTYQIIKYDYIYGYISNMSNNLYSIVLKTTRTFTDEQQYIFTVYNAGAYGSISHIEGNGSIAIGDYAHAEGNNACAIGLNSHAEGQNTKAIGQYSHAEGLQNVARGNYSHIEGAMSTVDGNYSHAEGYSTQATGYAAHTEGLSTRATGHYAHAEGDSTTANHRAQHVFGRYNIADPSTNDPVDIGTYIEIVGNGDGPGAGQTYRNARTLDWSGNEVLSGTLTVSSAGITIGNTTITEAQLQNLLVLLNN